MLECIIMSEKACSQNHSSVQPEPEKHLFTVFYQTPLDEFNRDLLYLQSDQTGETIHFILPRFLKNRTYRNMKLEYHGHLDNRPETATVILKDAHNNKVLQFKKIKPKKHLDAVTYQLEFPLPNQIAHQQMPISLAFEKMRS